MKILLLAPYPLSCAPSQRFRFEHYLDSMSEENLHWDFQSFLSQKGWDNLYKQGKSINKLAAVAFGFARRCKLLFSLSKYDIVFIHRETAPLGPPIFEFVIAKIFRKRIIYDFDDAIWMADQSNENTIWKALKWRKKVSTICHYSWKTTTGNDYLSHFASNYCQQVITLPTVVNTQRHKKSGTKKSEIPVIGWTGSHSTLFYLDAIVPVLKQLENRFEFEFLVIANRNPQLDLKNFKFIKWNVETEIEDLDKIDIGIMPLEDTEWAKGKCGFKLIQYLSLGIATVASPVGVNSEIVKNGVTGFIACNENEWIDGLMKLLSDETLRQEMGETGRLLIEQKYSVNSQKEAFLDLFRL
jgi:glycosyltransferase involved in cell wall biosynthesis